MNNVSPTEIVVAAVIAIITTLVSFKVLRPHAVLNNPFLCVCVGGLTFFGLLISSDGWAGIILSEYAALGLTILVLLFLLPFRRVRGKEIRRSPPNRHPAHEQDASPCARNHGQSNGMYDMRDDSSDQDDVPETRQAGRGKCPGQEE